MHDKQGYAETYHDVIHENQVKIARAMKTPDHGCSIKDEVPPACPLRHYAWSAKLIFPDMCKEPRFYRDTTGTCLANTACCLGTDDRYLLGVLNSRLFWFTIVNISLPSACASASIAASPSTNTWKRCPSVSLTPPTSSTKPPSTANSPRQMRRLTTKSMRSTT